MFFRLVFTWQQGLYAPFSCFIVHLETRSADNQPAPLSFLRFTDSRSLHNFRSTQVSMRVLWLIAVFLSAVSLANRDSGHDLCRSYSTPPLAPKPAVVIQSSLLPTLNTLPLPYICSNRKLLPIPPTKLNFTTAFLLLLAGDVAVNPGPTTQHHNLRVGSINARSMREKAPALFDLVQSKSLDILTITETWLTPKETTASLADVTPPDFSFHQNPRSGRTGGGVGIFISDALSFKPFSIPARSSLKQSLALLHLASHVLRF